MKKAQYLFFVGIAAFFIPGLTHASYLPAGCFDETPTSATVAHCYFFSDHHSISVTGHTDYGGFTFSTSTILYTDSIIQTVNAFDFGTTIGPFWYAFTESGTGDIYFAQINISNYIPGNFFNSSANGNSIFSSSTIPSNLFNFGGVSTTSAATYCDANMPFDDSSIIRATITFIPNGLCKLGFFLVVPSTDSLNQFENIASSTTSRFPFSYILSATTVLQALVASSSSNSPSINVNLRNLGIASSTYGTLGNILPNFEAFSASTTKAYFPPGSFDLLKSLAKIAIILTLVGDIFFSTKKMMKS